MFHPSSEPNHVYEVGPHRPHAGLVCWGRDRHQDLGGEAGAEPGRPTGTQGRGDLSTVVPHPGEGWKEGADDGKVKEQVTVLTFCIYEWCSKNKSFN